MNNLTKLDINDPDEIVAGNAIVFHVPIACKAESWCKLEVKMTGDSTGSLGE